MLTQTKEKGKKRTNGEKKKKRRREKKRIEALLGSTGRFDVGLSKNLRSGKP
jgi:hypothetical protein